MLHTTTEGKKTSESGTLPSRVVCTVELRNSRVLSWRKKPPESTDMVTTRDQNEMRNVEIEQDTSLEGKKKIERWHSIRLTARPIGACCVGACASIGTR